MGILIFVVLFFVVIASTLVISDRVPPLLLVPSEIIREATSSTGARVVFSITANDVVDGEVSPKCDHQSGDILPLGLTKVTCTAADSRGNSAIPQSFNVIIQDRTKPNVIVPQDIDVLTADSSGTQLTYPDVRAEDTVSGSLIATCDYASGAIFPIGRNEVKCSATDDAGNKGENSFFVIVAFRDVNPPFAPIISAPENSTVMNNSIPLFGGVAEPLTTVRLYDRDAEEPIATAEVSSAGKWFTRTNALNDGIHFITATATDGAGNTSPISQSVSIRIDTIEPLAPMLRQPDGSCSDETPTFYWDLVNDESGVSYTLQVWPKSDPNHFDIHISNLTSTSYPSVSDQLAFGQYYEWAVYATDGAGNVGDSVEPLDFFYGFCVG
jgi:hypothetical protein